MKRRHMRIVIAVLTVIVGITFAAGVRANDDSGGGAGPMPIPHGGPARGALFRWAAASVPTHVLPVCLTFAATCWLCAALATPRKPLPRNEVEELVYSRLLGRRQTLVLMAAIATAAIFFALIVALPQRASADLQSSRAIPHGCGGSVYQASAECGDTGQPADIWGIKPWHHLVPGPGLLDTE